MNLQPKIIFQTKDYVVLDKPAGISVHKDGRSDKYTLADWILENFPETNDVGESMLTNEGVEIKKPGIVHRLDKDTSGVMLIALNQASYEYFKKQFKDRQIQKVYHLFAYGNIRDDIVIVDQPMGKDRVDFRKRTTRNPRGKIRDARTEIKVLHRGKVGDELYVFLEARPKTGRMHQIRVHMKYLNSPIVCDRLYSPKRKSILGFERLALHSKEILFVDLEGKEQRFKSEYPSDFQKAIQLNNVE